MVYMYILGRLCEILIQVLHVCKLCCTRYSARELSELSTVSEFTDESWSYITLQ